jgi:hypothetical protein
MLFNIWPNCELQSFAIQAWMFPLERPTALQMDFGAAAAAGTAAAAPAAGSPGTAAAGAPATGGTAPPAAAPGIWALAVGIAARTPAKRPAMHVFPDDINGSPRAARGERVQGDGRGSGPTIRACRRRDVVEDSRLQSLLSEVTLEAFIGFEDHGVFSDRSSSID